MNNKINVSAISDDFITEETVLQRLVNWILQNEHSTYAWAISIVFVDDPFIIDLNKKFLEKSAPTDVISFNLTDDSNKPEGEIYISVETAARNAGIFNVEMQDEIYRLVAHGVYHLLL